MGEVGGAGVGVSAGGFGGEGVGTFAVGPGVGAFAGGVFWAWEREKLRAARKIIVRTAAPVRTFLLIIRLLRKYLWGL
jgi:hypothetical protein